MKLEELVTLILIVVAVFFKNLPLGAVLGIVLSVYIAIVYGDFIYRSYLTLNRDLRYAGTVFIRCVCSEVLFQRPLPDFGYQIRLVEEASRKPWFTRDFPRGRR